MECGGGLKRGREDERGVDEEGHSVGVSVHWHGLIEKKWMGGVRKGEGRGEAVESGNLESTM